MPISPNEYSRFGNSSNDRQLFVKLLKKLTNQLIQVFHHNICLLLSYNDSESLIILLKALANQLGFKYKLSFIKSVKRNMFSTKGKGEKK